MKRILFCLILGGILIGSAPVWSQIYGQYQSPMVIKPGQVEGGVYVFFMEDLNASGACAQARFGFDQHIDWGLKGGIIEAEFNKGKEEVGFFIGGEGKYQLLDKKNSDLYLSLGSRLTVTKADNFNSFILSGFALAGDTILINKKKNTNLLIYSGLGLDIVNYEKIIEEEDEVELEFFVPLGIKYWWGQGFSVAGEITFSKTTCIGGGINIYF
ncbi:MAG: hypothetical protein AB1797_09680 [bacterium]